MTIRSAVYASIAAAATLQAGAVGADEGEMQKKQQQQQATAVATVPARPEI